jgi:myo-inositol-1(or 4)-monophosphatase
MKVQHKAALAAAVAAAQRVGKLLLANRRSKKKINEATQHDIKLELDVRSQKLIERRLRHEFPEIPILGEEGVVGEPNSPHRWVVDPIDGTVNFTYGIPHACVSIALQASLLAVSAKRKVLTRKPSAPPAPEKLPGPYVSLVGVIYDPFTDELWTAVRGQPARLNGRVIQVSRREKLEESIIAIGFAKEQSSLEKMLPAFNQLVHRVRKVRMMGSAALDLAYVASGRLDAYLEQGLRLWDIAAGGLIIECAGGEFWHEPVPGEHKYRIIASNGRLRPLLEKYM